MTRKQFLQHLQNAVLRTPRLAEAFAAIDRADFGPSAYKDVAYEDTPLPLGFGSTISQPSTVAFMLELLQPRAGDRILDVGSGSGWTTALLGFIVGQKGKVIGVELVPELVKFAQQNIAPHYLPQVTLTQADSQILGWPKQAPYDRILVSADSPTLPQDLINQLKTGGTLVAPIAGSVYKIIKLAADKIEAQEFPGFAFVPLR